MIHDRMPLLVERERYGAWLDPDVGRPGPPARAARPRGPRPAGRLPGLDRRQQRRATTARSGPAAARLVRRLRWPRRFRRAVLSRADLRDRDAGRPRQGVRARGHRTTSAGVATGGAGPRARCRRRGRRPATWPPLAARLPAARGDHGARRAALAGGRRPGGRGSGPARPGLGRRARRPRAGRPAARRGRPARRRRAQRRGPGRLPDGRGRRRRRWSSCLAFPLHPPGRPERSRADELPGAGVPALVVQGERDPFGGPAEITAAVLAAGVAGRPGLRWCRSRRPTTGSPSRPAPSSPRGRRSRSSRTPSPAFLLRPAGRAG